MRTPISDIIGAVLLSIFFIVPAWSIMIVFLLNLIKELM
jgi:hypothetical protein